MLCTDSNFLCQTILHSHDNDGYGGPSDHNCDAVYRPSLFYLTFVRLIIMTAQVVIQATIAMLCTGRNFFATLFCTLMIMTAMVVLQTTFAMLCTGHHFNLGKDYAPSL